MNRLISRRALSSARLLRTTEEFPYNVSLTPAKSTPAVTKESKLANGVRIISRENGSPYANVRIAVLGGSGTESLAEKGAANFLTAAAYSGNKFNTGIRFIKYFETLGAKVNARFDREKIVFELDVLTNTLDESFSGLVSAVASGPYAPHVYHEEVLPIAESRFKNHHSNPRSRVTELLHEAAFGEETRLGASTHSLNYHHLSHEDVDSYREKHFVAGNLVIAATGVSHDKLKSLVEAHVVGGALKSPATSVAFNFSQIPVGDAPVAPFAKAAPYVGGVAKQREDLGGNVHTGLAFGVPSGAAAKPYAVLKSHLAAKFGCENVSLHNYSDGGLVTLFGNAADIESAITELKGIASGSVDTAASKHKAALDYFLALEGDKSVSTLLNAHLNGDGDVRSVTKDEVVNAAKAVLKSSPSYAVVGNTAAAPSHAQVIQWWK